MVYLWVSVIIIFYANVSWLTWEIIIIIYATVKIYDLKMSVVTKSGSVWLSIRYLICEAFTNLQDLNF